MAVTNLYKATASPAHNTNIFSLRGIFSCCYGRRRQNKTADGKNSGDDQRSIDTASHLVGESSGSEDSDEEVQNNFSRLQKGASFRALGESEAFQNAFREASAKKMDAGLASGNGKTSLDFNHTDDSSRPANESQSLLWGSKATSKAQSVVSYGGDSGGGAVGVARSMATSVTPSLPDDAESSEHMSDDSSMTQYSEEFGDTQQMGAAFAEASDEEESGKRPTAVVSTLGELDVGIMFEPRKARLHVRIRGVKDVPDREKGGTTAYQLHMVLLPDKRQRFKTKQRSASRLSFEETFVFTKVSPNAIAEQALRVRLYGCERMRRERLVAETVVALTTFELGSEEKFFNIPLEPRTKLKTRKFVTELLPSKGGPPTPRTKTFSSGSDTSSSAPTSPIRKSGDSNSDASSYHSLENVVMHGNNLPEILLGLSYNGTTGRLAVEVVRGSTFIAPSISRPPDAYVKLSILSSNGQTFARSKTSIRRHDPNPLFKETFMFQIAMFQMDDITLMVFVYHKKNIRRKESIGWFSLGLNSSGEEEVAHWQDMRDALGDRVFRWHLLLEPS